MIKISLLFKKISLITFVAVFALAALPLTSVHASGLGDPSNPPVGTTQVSDKRLEQIWVRLQKVYVHQGKVLDRANQMVVRFQNLVNRMEGNGKDTTALQAALDTFNQSLKDAHPLYEGTKGIIDSHQGFDASGKVTDHDKALLTVQALHDNLKEVRQLIGEPGRLLREAVRAFREANKPLI